VRKAGMGIGHSNPCAAGIPDFGYPSARLGAAERDRFHFTSSNFVDGLRDAGCRSPPQRRPASGILHQSCCTTLPRMASFNLLRIQPRSADRLGDSFRRGRLRKKLERARLKLRWDVRPAESRPGSMTRLRHNVTVSRMRKGQACYGKSEGGTTGRCPLKCRNERVLVRDTGGGRLVSVGARFRKDGPRTSSDGKVSAELRAMAG